MKTLTLKRNLSEDPVIGKLYDGDQFIGQVIDSGLEAGNHTIAYQYDNILKTRYWAVSGGAFDGLKFVTPSRYVTDGAGIAVLQDVYIEDESKAINVLKSRSNLIALRTALRGEATATVTVEETSAGGGGGGSPDTPAEIKTKYESLADTNEYSDAEKIKVGLITLTAAKDFDTVEEGAEVNPSDAEIVSSITAALGNSGWQGSGGAIGSSIAPQQIAFATATDTVGGSSELLWDGQNIMIRGSSANRYIRFHESTGAYNGGFINFDGAANKMFLGVHPTGDALEANDIRSICINRAEGFVGIFTDTPNYQLDVEGTIRCDGARISPTFTDFTSRVSLVNPSFGSTRLGDSALQTPSLDVEVISFKTDAQQTQVSMFVNTAGNTMTVRGADDGILVIDQTNTPVDFATEFAESTYANSIEHSAGGRYINDQGVQYYYTNGSVVAQCHFQVLQNTGGLARMPFKKYWYDGTTYERIYEIGTDGVLDYEKSPTAPDATASNELATLGQVSLETEVIVKSASQLSGTLSSDVVYVIDGDLDMGSTEITAPAGGLFMRGTSYFTSGLYSTAANYTMFKSASGVPTSNVRMEELYFWASGTGSKLFALDGTGNDGSIEFNSCNIGDFGGNTTSIGELTSFRQFRTQDCGFFKVQDGLTFTGPWDGGFRITDTIVLEQAASSTLFKPGTGLVFGGRCISDINAASVDPTTITFDFVPANFTLHGGFQLIGASFAPLSAISVTTDETSVKSFFEDNVEIKNTHVRALISSATQVPNLFVASEEKVSGTSTQVYATWMSTSDNRITIDTNQVLDVEAAYKCRIDAGPNDEIAVSIKMWDASASAFVVVVREVRTVSNVIGGLDVVDFDIEGVAQSVTAGDYFEPFIENTSDSSPATVLTGAKLKVVRL